MNTLNEIKRYVKEVWLKSDQTTTLSFSDDTGRYGDTFYRSGDHLIHICAGFLYVQYQKYFEQEMSLETYTKLATAHELGHSIDTSNSYARALNELMEAVLAGDEAHINRCRDTIFNTKMEEEAFAWNNAMHFLENFSEKEFLIVSKHCLSSYVIDRDNSFESLLSIFTEMKSDKMMKRIFLEMQQKSLA